MTTNNEQSTPPYDAREIALEILLTMDDVPGETPPDTIIAVSAIANVHATLAVAAAIAEQNRLSAAILRNLELLANPIVTVKVPT